MLNHAIFGLLVAAGLGLAACNAEAPPPQTAEDALPVLSEDASWAYAALDADVRLDLAACDVDAAEFDRLMALPENAFDQDFTGGWRPVGDKDDCHSAAGDLILAYIAYSVPKPPDSVKILRWHAGQMKAFAGETTAALALFAGTYENADNVEWNHYVDATLAFLQQDLAGIESAYEELSTSEVSDASKAARQRFLDNNPTIRMPDGYLTDPANLPVIKRLSDCFGRPYKEAYRGCDTSK
ncbi:MAG: hypothetical protein ACSHX3_11525 [Litorimonas sp.]